MIYGRASKIQRSIDDHLTARWEKGSVDDITANSLPPDRDGLMKGHTLDGAFICTDHMRHY